MLYNQNGSTLIQALLVILIFSILGVSLIGNVVGENKRVNKTDAKVQSRNLVRDGLTYFEADFKNRAKSKGYIDLYHFLYVTSDGKPSYSAGKVVKIEGEDIKIKAEIVPPSLKQSAASDAFTIKVTSQIIDSEKYEEDSLHAYYTVDFDVDFKTAAATLGDFSQATELDVSKALINLKNLSLTKLGLGALIGHLNLEKTISLSLLPYGSYQDYYPIPDDKLLGGLISTGGIDLLNIINLQGSGNTFNYLKDVEAVTVRNTSLIKADVDTNNLELLGLIDLVGDIGLNLKELYLNLSLIDLQKNTGETNDAFKPTNVIINGGLGGLDLSTTALVSSLDTTLGNLLHSLGLGILDILLKPIFDLLGGVTGILDKLADGLLDILNNGINGRNGYEDITIKKLGITGHGLITQGSDDPDLMRAFTFTNGLFVKQSLNIGTYNYKKEEADGLIEAGPVNQLNKYSNVKLNGDMLAADTLNMNNASLEFVKSNLYVYDILGKKSNDAVLKNSCIKLTNDTQSRFNLLVNGKMNVIYSGNDSQQCRTLSGVYFSEKGIDIKTNNRDVVIHGVMFGDITADHPERVKFTIEPKYLDGFQMNNAKLIPLGRTYD